MSKKNKTTETTGTLLESAVPADVLHESGRLGLTIDKALELLQGKIPPEEHALLTDALKNPDSPEMRQYKSGTAKGEAEIANALHTGVTDLEKDGYKNMDAERRHKAVSKSIRKNFGIGADDEE